MRFFPVIMKVISILLILFLIILLILLISNKIYILIHTNFILGRLFPYPKMSAVIIAVTVALLLLAFFIIYLIRKIKKHLHH